MKTRQPMYRKAYTDISLQIDIWCYKNPRYEIYFELPIDERPGRRYYGYHSKPIKFVDKSQAA